MDCHPLFSLLRQPSLPLKVAGTLWTMYPSLLAMSLASCISMTFQHNTLKGGRWLSPTCSDTSNKQVLLKTPLEHSNGFLFFMIFCFACRPEGVSEVIVLLLSVYASLSYILNFVILTRHHLVHTLCH